MSSSSQVSSVPSAMQSRPARPRREATVSSVRRALAVVRRLGLSLWLSRWDDERIAQHRDAVYRQVQRLPIA